MKSKNFCDYCDKKGCSKGGNQYGECYDGNKFRGIELISPKVVEQLTWEVEMLQEQLELCEERFIES